MDLSELWKARHSHLRPYAYALKGRHLAKQHNGSVLADVEFNRNIRIEKVAIQYEQSSSRFWIDSSELSRIQQLIPGAQDLVASSIDARLWTRDITMINIEPTTRCNFSCWYCVGRQMIQEDIDPRNFAKMLKNFPNVKTIALVGEGEPLMHKGFFEMARSARDHGARVLIISNGSTLSTSNVQQLCDAEVAYIAVSIDSIDPDQFARSRIGGDLNQVWRGIERLRIYRDRHGYRYPKIALKGTLFSYSQNDLKKIVNEAFSRGIEIFESFQALNPKESYVNFYPKEMLSEVSQAPLVSQVMANDVGTLINPLKAFEVFCQEEGIEIPSPMANRLRGNCDETWLYSLLSGDITPCCQIKQSPSKQWNVFEQPVSTILNDMDYENLRFNLWNGIFPDSCMGCWKTLS